MKIHDPREVAQLAALILSSQPDPERHHIKKAVAAAGIVLDEAFLKAEADEAAAAAAGEAAAEKPDAEGKPSTGKNSDDSKA